MNIINRFSALCLGSIVLFAPFRLMATQVVTVSPAGRDTWTGAYAEPLPDGTDGPLATLTRAMERVRELISDPEKSREDVIVSLREGTYFIEETLNLSAEASGIAPASVTWQAFPAERVILHGGLPVTNFQLLSESDVRSRIPEAYHDRVYVANLRELGIPFPREVSRRSLYELDEPGPLQVYYGDELMTLARYPNDGWVHVADVPQESGKPLKEGHHADRRDGKVPTGRHFGAITYAGDRPSSWASHGTIWMHGYWTWDWAESTQRIEEIDSGQRRITIAGPHHRYGYTTGQRYTYFNIPEELDSPGEWYLDRESGDLFFWPPGEAFTGEIVVSVLDKPMIRIKHPQVLN